ncbi:unnamed protein product [Coffea canephora]|uniref:Uncharacterized protein n=1 Tax=Coffea canephora TaxID=49390 RepID=A0A068UJT3_COFCA|nr:unnamed protein product [Coffea canephora]
MPRDTIRYLYLSKLVTIPRSSGAFLRLFLDQFLFSPIFIGFFLSTLVTLEGRPSQVIPKLEQVLSVIVSSSSSFLASLERKANDYRFGIAEH